MNYSYSNSTVLKYFKRYQLTRETWRKKAIEFNWCSKHVFEKLPLVKSKPLPDWIHVFFTPQTINGLPAAGGIFLAYVMPAYLLGGLHKDITNDLKHEDFNTFFYYSGKYVENDILIVFTEINS